MDQDTQQEIERLNQTVDDFATEMKARLHEQAIKGYRGWDDPEQYQQIKDMMIHHASVSSGQEVDAANLAMILWFLRQQGGVG
ncbi:MAG: hypothetical protein V3V22_11095 [Methylococcales bacterium]